MYIPPEIRASLDEVERRAGYLWKFLDVAGKQAAIAKLEELMTAQNFWDSQKAAQKVISECNGHKVIVAPQVAFRRQIEDAKTLAELITESPDGTADAEVEELRKLGTDLLAAVSELEIASFLSGLHDRSNAIVTVKHGSKTKPWEVDAISGATITSRAVGKAINDAAQVLLPRVAPNLDKLKEKS